MIFWKAANRKKIVLLLLIFPSSIFAQSQDYLIKGREILQISVYNNTDLDTTVRTSESGVISFPLIGQVSVLGLTVKEIEKKISGLLRAKGIVKKPDVNVFIEQYKPKKYTVLGEVNKPGQYEIFGNDTVYLTDVLSLSSGFTQDADENVTIIRNINGKQEKKTVNLYSLLGSNIMDSDAMSIEALNYQVFDSDTIYVPRAPYFYIHGAVKNPGYYKIEPGLTIERAIIIGGGHTKMASRDQIEIKREGNKKELFFNINSKEAPGPSAKTIDFYEVRIQKDDVLFIPEVGSFYVYGEAGKPGAYKFEKGMSVIKALSIAGGITQNASKQIRITRKVGDEETTFKTDLNALIKEDDILIVRESLF